MDSSKRPQRISSSFFVHWEPETPVKRGGKENRTFMNPARWAPPSYKWSDFTPVSRVITAITHLFLAIYNGEITPFITTLPETNSEFAP